MVKTKKFLSGGKWLMKIRINFTEQIMNITFAVTTVYEIRWMINKEFMSNRFLTTLDFSASFTEYLYAHGCLILQKKRLPPKPAVCTSDPS